jgi:hypothetical protein
MMMKKVFLILNLLLAVAILPVISSCSSDSVSAALGKEFTLPVGKTAAISGESLKIQFVQVTADSRCPTGVQCIQAGSANCDMLFNYKGLDYNVTLTAGSGLDKVVFTDYNISYNLQPYPVSGSKIDPKGYNLRMMVTK